MDNSKDYIVRYKIEMNASEAATGLSNLSRSLEEYIEPFNDIQKTMAQLTGTLREFKTLDKLVVTPKLETSKFDEKLKDMVSDVEKAAIRMSATIRKAFTGESISASGSEKSTAKSSVQEASAISSAAKSLKKEKETVNRIISDTGSKSTPKSFESTLESFIEWKKFLDDSQKNIPSFTVNANTTAAFKAIEDVEKKLKELNPAAKFEINPTMNLAGFEKAEQKLKELAKLSNMVVAPFAPTNAVEKKASHKKLTGDEKRQLEEAKVNLDILNEEKQKIEKRLDKNALKYHQSPNNSLKGWLTRDTKTLEDLKKKEAEYQATISRFGEKVEKPVMSAATAARQMFLDITGNINRFEITGKVPTVMVEAKLLTDDLLASIKSLPTPTIDVNLKVNANSMMEQVRALTGGAVPGSGIESEPKKKTKLQDKSHNNEKSPLKKGLEPKKNAGAPFVVDVMGKFAGFVKENIPAISVDAKLNLSGISKQIKEMPRLSIPLAVKLMWSGGAVGKQQQLKSITEGIKPIPIGLNTKAAMEAFEKFIGTIRSNDSVSIALKLTSEGVSKQIKEMPRQTMPVSIKLTWPGGAVGRQEQLKKINEGIKPIPIKLDTSPAVQALNELISLIQSKSPQNIKINASGSASESAKKEANRAVKKSAVQNEVVQQANRMPISKSDWIVKESIRAAELRGMAEDAAHAFSNLTPYEKKLRKSEAAESLARHKRLRDKLEAGAFNAALPFAENKEQAKMMVKYRKFFKSAAIAGDYDLSPDMDISTKYRYLQDVSELMRKSNTSIPWQLQSQINKIGKKLEREELLGIGGGGGGGRGVPVDNRSFFDKSRKWAFPFTGPTSFGSNTPMAVEMAKGMGAAYAIEGAMSVIGGSFGQAVNYQNIMSTTQSILQNGTDTYTDKGFKEMERIVRNVGIKTKFSAPEVAEAAKFLAMAGYDISAINNSIRPIADLALIGDADLGETADKMTNIMTTFNIAPKNMRAAANIMATTAMRSNTDLMMLAESAKYGGGVANLYGKNDPNLFADTMALFGVMGNAGIQSSSAGTALRMMYQNIFKPNKNQKAVLDWMKSNYGISTMNEDGSYRSLSEIITDMSNLIPENMMAQVVGNLFRITAQPGAASVLNAAKGDWQEAMRISEGINVVADQMSTKAGLSSLAALMHANRESVNTNTAGSISDKKQNNIMGLWSQVTSTFTEAILRSFESRIDEFEDMLKGLRDYFSDPKTLAMIQTFMDAIVEIGKSLAFFAQIWAKLYTTFPGLIASWIRLQMVASQMGALMSPFVQLTGIIDRFGGILKNAAAASKAANAANAAENVANIVSAATTVGAEAAKKGKVADVVSTVANVAEAGAAGASLVSAGKVAESVGDIAETVSETVSIFGEVKEAYEMGQSLGEFSSVSSIWQGIKATIASVSAQVAKFFGMILSPLGVSLLLIGTISGGLYKMFHYLNGTTEDQILVQQKLAEQSEAATRIMVQNSEWYQEQLNKFSKDPMHITSSVASEAQRQSEERARMFNEEFSSFINGFSDIDNDKALRQHLDSWYKRVETDPLYRYALGSGYAEDLNERIRLLGIGSQATTSMVGTMPIYGFFGEKLYSKRIQQMVGEDAIRAFASRDERLKQFNQNVEELYKKYGNTQKYYDEANKLKNSIIDISKPGLIEFTPGDKISDPTAYRVYELGVEKIANAMIAGNNGTLVGKMMAYENAKRIDIPYNEKYFEEVEKHKETISKIKAFSDEWYEIIGNVIGDFPMTLNYISKSTGKLGNIKDIRLSMLPNGQIDTDTLLKQVNEIAKEFNLDLETYADMIAKLYLGLAQFGLAPNSKEGAQKFVEGQMKHMHVSPNDVDNYWFKYMPSTSLPKENWSVDKYRGFVTDSKNNPANIWGKDMYPSGERVEIRKTFANAAVDRLFEQQEKAADMSGKTVVPFAPGVTPTTNGTSGTTGNGNGDKTNNPSPLTTSNDPYKNHYRSQAPRPTQITFNINELVHFDRTTVAANAEEKQLMESMESKITEVVYKIFAEAANQAHTLIGA